MEILGTAHHYGRNPAPRKGTERLFLAFLESPSAVLGSDRHLEKRRKQLIDEKKEKQEDLKEVILPLRIWMWVMGVVLSTNSTG